MSFNCLTDMESQDTLKKIRNVEYLSLDSEERRIPFLWFLFHFWPSDSPGDQ